MNLLAFDSSTPTGSVAVLSQGRVLAELTLSVSRTHSEHLMPAVEEVVATSGLELRELEALAVGTGPGSYTGIRIGLGTAMGLAYALDLPVVGISTLEAIAMGVWPAPGLIFSLIEARKDEVYCGLFRSLTGSGYLEQVRELEVLKLPQIKELVAGERAILVGSGAWRHRPELEGLLGKEITFAPDSLAHPQASRLGLLAQARLEEKGASGYSTAALEPIYLRRPYV